MSSLSGGFFIRIQPTNDQSPQVHYPQVLEIGKSMTEMADVTTITTTTTTATTTSNYYYTIEIPHNRATMMETFLERKGVKNEIETHNR